MSSLKDITKLYPALSPEERLSAMIAARSRDDMAEYDNLWRTAPKGKTYQVRDFFGIAEAWEWLTMWHLIFQFGLVGSFNYLVHFEDEPDKVIKDHYSRDEYSITQAIDLTAQRILEGRDAWRAICAEYNIDPNDAVKDYPFLEFLELTELTVDSFAAEKGITPKETEGTIEGYRLAIAKKRGEWE